MKKLLSLSLFVLVSIGLSKANANTIEMKSSPFEQQHQQAADSVKKTPVELEALPEAVKTALAGEQYQGLKVESALLVETQNKPSYYEITLRREGELESTIVKLDADGKVIE